MDSSPSSRSINHIRYLVNDENRAVFYLPSIGLHPHALCIQSVFFSMRI